MNKPLELVVGEKGYLMLESVRLERVESTDRDIAVGVLTPMRDGIVIMARSEGDAVLTATVESRGDFPILVHVNPARPPDSETKEDSRNSSSRGAIKKRAPHSSLGRTIQSLCAKLMRFWATTVSSSREPEIEKIEILSAPCDDREWKLAFAHNAKYILANQYVPVEASIENWTELVTITSSTIFTPFPTIIEAEVANIRRRIIDGDLTWSVLFQSEHELIYEWTVRNDMVIGYHYEAVRVIKGNTRAHSVHYATRNSPSAWQSRTEWIPRLRAARLTYGEPATPPSAPAEKVHPNANQDRFNALLSEIGETKDLTKREALCREALLLIDRGTSTTKWASVQLLYGMTALGLSRPKTLIRTKQKEPGSASSSMVASFEDIPPEASSWIETCIGSLRKVLEVITIDIDPKLWIGAVKYLAEAFLRREEGDRASNIERAIKAYVRVLAVLDSQRAPGEWVEVMTHLGTAYSRRLLGEAHENLAKAEGAVQEALRVCRKDSMPGEWSAAMSLAGEILEKKGSTFVDRAHEVYEEVLEAVYTEPAFELLEYEQLANVVGTIATKIYHLDAESDSPILTHEFLERERRHGAVYLRAFSLTRALLLQNRFRDVHRLEVQYAQEPEWISLEAALYRILAPSFDFFSVGGNLDSLGGGRFLCIGGNAWRTSVMAAVEASHVVLMVPSASPGIRWEAEFLAKKEAFAKWILIMPPLSSHYDAPAIWHAATDMMGELHLQLPPYRPEGCFFRLQGDGTIRDSWSFDDLWDATLSEELTRALVIEDEPKVT